MNEGHESDRNDCDHEWKAVEETHDRTHFKLVCVECGETKETSSFRRPRYKVKSDEN